MNAEQDSQGLSELSSADAIARSVMVTIARMGLAQRISVEAGRTRAGKDAIVLSGHTKSIQISAGAGLEQFAVGNPHTLIRFIEKLISDQQKEHVSTCELFDRPEFARSCIDTIGQKAARGNSVICDVAGLEPGVVPCLYGSTSGLNFAELLETMRCAEVARAHGYRAEAVFDVSGADGAKARLIYEESLEALSPSHRSACIEFASRFGDTPSDQVYGMARMLVEDKPRIVTSLHIATRMGGDFTLGKLLLLARMTGGDPVVMERRGAYSILSGEALDMGMHVSELAAQDHINSLGGIVYYARGAVLAADCGEEAIIFPVKMTTHADIYKLLGMYGGLAAQRSSQGVASGAILCPIQRHRIQTAAQAAQGSSPCDVRVLGYLAATQRDAFERLREDFQSSCTVIPGHEAEFASHHDVRLIIDRYFTL